MSDNNKSKRVQNVVPRPQKQFTNSYLKEQEHGTLEDLKKMKETRIDVYNKVKPRSETILSLKERKIIERITQKKAQNQKEAKNKLIWVSIICIFFMAVESVGGYFSGSISIWSDAAHMFSDFSGFAISMTSIYLSAKSPTESLSYGYYRCEVIGALISVLSIWGISSWLVIEAIHRITTEEVEIEGTLMIIVAVIGFICNLLMGHVLHSTGGHSHGLGGECPHSKKDKDDDIVENEHGHSHDNNEHGHSHDKEEHGHSHDNNEHGHSHGKEEHGHNHDNNDHGHSHDNEEHGHNHDNNDHGHSHDNEAHGHSHGKQEHNHNESNESEDSVKKTKAINQTTSMTDPLIDPEDKIVQKKKEDHGHSHEHGHDHDHDHDHEENLNIRAALVHVIGDLFQSIGVIIASVCIKLWPQAKIIDPICTFVFCFIVLLTTVPILFDCIKILMESTPSNLKIKKIQEGLEAVEGVVEVHDLHVWSLNTSTKSLTVHLKSTDPMVSLKRATRLVNTKFKILHTTIQVETVDAESDSDSDVTYQCAIYH